MEISAKQILTSQDCFHCKCFIGVSYRATLPNELLRICGVKICIGFASACTCKHEPSLTDVILSYLVSQGDVNKFSDLEKLLLYLKLPTSGINGLDSHHLKRLVTWWTSSISSLTIVEVACLMIITVLTELVRTPGPNFMALLTAKVRA